MKTTLSNNSDLDKSQLPGKITNQSSKESPGKITNRSSKASEKLISNNNHKNTIDKDFIVNEELKLEDINCENIKDNKWWKHIYYTI